MENLAFTYIEPVFRKVYLFFYVFTVSPRITTPDAVLQIVTLA